MSKLELVSNIHSLINGISDYSTLVKVRDFISEAIKKSPEDKVIGYTVKGESLTIDQLNKKLDEAQGGRKYSSKEVQQMVHKWASE